MSTRGAFGYYRKGKTIVGYNHWDSYPSGLGQEVLTFLKGKSIQELRQKMEAHKDCDADHVWDWYEHQPYNHFNSVVSLLENSIECDWAYILNLDQEVLEIWEGRNKKKEDETRYKSKKSNNGYYAVCLQETIPLEFCFRGYVYIHKEEFCIKKTKDIIESIERKLKGRNITYSVDEDSLRLDSDTGNGVLFVKGILSVESVTAGEQDLIYHLNFYHKDLCYVTNEGKVTIREQNIDKVLNFVLTP